MKDQPCPSCNGTGSGPHDMDCSVCHGNGYVSEEQEEEIQDEEGELYSFWFDNNE